MLTLRVHAARVVAGGTAESGVELTVLDGYVFYYVAAVCIGATHKALVSTEGQSMTVVNTVALLAVPSASSLADDRLIKGFLS